MNKQKYFFYVLLGLLCPVVIGIYYVNYWVCDHVVGIENTRHVHKSRKNPA